MYRVYINRDALKYIDTLTEKSKSLIKRKLETLKDNPHPGRGDKKKLQLPKIQEDALKCDPNIPTWNIQDYIYLGIKKLSNGRLRLWY